MPAMQMKSTRSLCDTKPAMLQTCTHHARISCLIRRADSIAAENRAKGIEWTKLVFEKT